MQAVELHHQVECHTLEQNGVAEMHDGKAERRLRPGHNTVGIAESLLEGKGGDHSVLLPPPPVPRRYQTQMGTFHHG